MFWKNFKISHKLFMGFGIVTLIMLLVLGYSQISFNKEEKALELNLRTYEAIRDTDNILINILNMETGARGYAITGKDEFLEPYNNGKADYEQHFNSIKRLTLDNPKQQERLITLNENYKIWLKWETDNLITGRQRVISGQEKMEDLIAAVQRGTGKKEMDMIRSILEDIAKEEQRLLTERSRELDKMHNQTEWVLSLGGLIAAFLAIVIAFWIIRLVVTPVKALTTTFMEIAQGEADFEFRLKVNSNDELGEMAKNFNVFMNKIKAITMENRNQSWIKTGQSELNERLRGDQDVETLATSAITYIAKYASAQIGAIYVAAGNNTFKLLGSYAYKRRKNLSNEVKVGEGLVGQSALERQTIIITEVPEDYVAISSGIGEAVPRNILVTPCIYNDEIKCIIELGTFQQFTELQLEFIERISGNIAVAIHSIEARINMQKLLDKTLDQSATLQSQQEELQENNDVLEEQAKGLKHSEARLQAQQEELRQSNEELEEQARALKESEARLQSQQEELRATNEELEERTKSLELQKNDITIKNENLRNAQIEIKDKAEAIEKTSKYKSEFLANMSHELRTPLNSILVLSQMLAEKNANTTLTDKQLEFASTIHSSGQDLLKLINDILDLSKVEAGKMDVTLEPINLMELAQYVERSFKPIALQKGLDLRIEFDDELPNITSDTVKLQQIVNNLLSNAFKFTHMGEVAFSIRSSKQDENLNSKRALEQSICISVADTGIGISKEKQSVIFEAFKQSDGTISRKYGGTGLGLSITKELARLLGGKIYLDSEEGKGSIFSLVLPKTYNEAEAVDQPAAVREEDKADRLETLQNNEYFLAKNNITSTMVNDDRENINESDKVLLIIEDDNNFSKILYELAHEKGYKCLVAEDGKSGIGLSNQYNPDAIVLDIGLPDVSGWKVIEKLQNNKKTKHIPIHVISGGENDFSKDKKDGIVSYIQKPVSLGKLTEVFIKIENIVSTTFKKVLVLAENADQAVSIVDLIGEKGIQVTFTDSGEEAYNFLQSETFDCIILDLKLKDMTGLALLEKLRDENVANIPVIIYTEKLLTQEEEEELQKYTESIVIKGSRSLERLIAEASLFLHDIDVKSEEKKLKVIKSNHEKENSLRDKKILVVDDDMRNVFALSSILEEKGMKVVVGRNGKEGIQKLQENSDIDMILMDIMMPIMDGYTAMREIRQELKWNKIPMIALTAKAMKDDKQKCIEAGANDYLTKPIDVEKFISLLRVWLYK